MTPTIVVITDRYLAPQNSGNVTRIVHLVRALRSAGYRVVLIAPELTDRLTPQLNAAVTRWRLRGVANRLIAVQAVPLQPGPPAYDLSPYIPSLERAVRRFNPVAVIAEYLWMAPALDAVTNGALKVVDTHDLFHARLDIYGSVEGGAWIACTREEEAERLHHADVIIAIQRHEQRAFQAMLPDKAVICVPHIVPLETAPGRSPVTRAPQIGFIASPNEGNAAGLEAFLQEAWPVIRGRHADASLRVFGGIEVCFSDKPGYPGVRFEGFIPKLRRAYETSTVMINPVQLGTGLKIKTVEAMAFGKAIVTTSCGAAGIEEGAGEAFVLEDDMSRFGDAVGELLADPTRRARIEREAIQFARRILDPAVALAELTAAIERHQGVMGVAVRQSGGIG